MPISQSAKKSLRSSLRKREFNLVRKFKIKNALKSLRKSVTLNAEEAVKNLSSAYSAIDKALKGRLIHKNAAARKKSRLALMVKKSALKPEIN